jgi:hypothetical protein
MRGHIVSAGLGYDLWTLLGLAAGLVCADPGREVVIEASSMPTE